MAKEKQTRRMIAMALAAAVTMSSVPVVAFADEVSGGTITESGEGTKESPQLKVTVTVNGPDESNQTTTVTKTETDWNQQLTKDTTVDFDGEKVDTVVTVPKADSATDSTDTSGEESDTPEASADEVVRDHHTTDDTTTTVQTTEDGTTTKVENVQTETGTREDGTIVDNKVESTTVTKTDADGNVIEEYETEKGSVKEDQVLEEDENETYEEVKVSLKPGETTSQAVTNTTGNAPIFDFENESNYDYTWIEEVERTVTATTSKIEVTVNDAGTGEVGYEAGGLKGLDPVYDETDLPRTDVQGKEDLFDRNYLSSEKMDRVQINGVTIWINDSTKEISNISVPEGTELPEDFSYSVGQSVSGWFNGSNVDKKKLPEGATYNNDVAINKIENWYDAEGNLIVDIPEGGDVMHVGTGEHGLFYNARVTVVYAKDANGDTIYKDGKPVIEKITKSDGTIVTIDGVPATELPEDVSLVPVFDNYNGGRPKTFMLMDKDGNRVYAYCCDMETGAQEGVWYSVSNLEDSDYYGSEESEEHIRSIVMNGYWGTSDIPDENGEYKTGSLESIKESLKGAIDSGKMANETVQMPAVDADGNPVVDEAGNPVMETKTMMELINDLTEGEALLATQSAIWAFANGHVGALNGKDGVVVIDPDGYKWNQDPANGSKTNSAGELLGVLNDYGSARVDFLYKWLIGLTPDTDIKKDPYEVVINEKNFVEDMSLTILDKATDETGAAFEENTDENTDNDIYNAALNFKLAFVPGDNDDLLVQVTYQNLEGETVNEVRRLAGKNADGQTYETITPGDDGSYVIKGLKLSENEDFNFDLRLEGTQYLEQGVFVYAPVGGRDVSQTFVGIAEGERDVDVSVGVTVSFDVDENDRVVARREWSRDSRHSNSGGGSDPKDPTPDPKDPNPTPDPKDPGMTIPEEDVPLAGVDEPLEDIADGDVPLADIPEEEVPLVAGEEEVIAATGDNNHMAAGFGGMLAALAGMFMLRRKKEN